MSISRWVRYPLLAITWLVTINNFIFLVDLLWNMAHASPAFTIIMFITPIGWGVFGFLMYIPYWGFSSADDIAPDMTSKGKAYALFIGLTILGWALSFVLGYVIGFVYAWL